MISSILLIVAALLYIFGIVSIFQRCKITEDGWKKLAFDLILNDYKEIYCTKCGKETTRKVNEPKEKSYDSTSGFITGHKILKSCSCGHCSVIYDWEINLGCYIARVKETFHLRIFGSFAFGTIFLVIASLHPPNY